VSFITKKNKTDYGFTYIELLIAIIIMSLLIIGVSQGLLTGTRILEKATVHTTTTGSILHMDNLIRENVARIYFPFWSGEINIEEGENNIEIPFFDGNKDTYLTFSMQDNYLNIAVKRPADDFSADNVESGYKLDPIQSFGKFSSADFKPATTPETGVVGVELTLQPLENKNPPVTIIARFGSLPIFLSNNKNTTNL
jgi:prepilin-type N-terminal cleavage/methylation domain-containing protein